MKNKNYTEYVLIGIVCLLMIGSILFHISEGTYVKILNSIVFLPIVLLPRIIEKIWNVTFPNSFQIMYIIFMILSYGLGTMFAFYRTVDHYDKLVHFISGFFIFYLGILAYVKLTKNKILPFSLEVTFLLGIASSIALIWEIAEYLFDQFLGGNTQRVIETGIHDTMMDVILALIGTIIMLIIYKQKRKYKSSFIEKFKKEVL